MNKNSIIWQPSIFFSQYYCRNNVREEEGNAAEKVEYRGSKLCCKNFPSQDFKLSSDKTDIIGRYLQLCTTTFSTVSGHWAHTIPSSQWQPFWGAKHWVKEKRQLIMWWNAIPCQTTSKQCARQLEDNHNSQGGCQRRDSSCQENREAARLHLSK